jgi:single-stranded-DNA-specific exonuclease
LHDALSRVHDCLTRFGGHQAAAGVELEASKLEEFRARFSEIVAEQRAYDDATGAPVEKESKPLPLIAGDDPLTLLADLDRLEPCGVSNPRPQLVVEGPLRSAREVKGGHLKLELDLPGRVLGGFVVAMGPRAAELSGRVALTGDLRHTTFPGSSGVEMFVEQIEPR